MDSLYTALNNLCQIFADYISTYDLIVTNNTLLNTAVIKSLTITDLVVYPVTHLITSLITQPYTLQGINQLINTNF